VTDDALIWNRIDNDDKRLSDETSVHVMEIRGGFEGGDGASSFLFRISPFVRPIRWCISPTPPRPHPFGDDRPTLGRKESKTPTALTVDAGVFVDL
jgi:hypothetical protein